MPFCNTTLKKRAELIDDIENNLDMINVVNRYKVSRGHCYKILHQKDDILKAIENGESKRKRLIVNSHIIELDNHMIEFVRDNNRRGFPVNGKFLKAEAKRFTQGKEDINLKFSNGWLEKLCKRIKIKHGKIRGESGGVNLNVVNQYRDEIPRIYSGWQDEFIYNADETGLFWRQFPQKTYFIKGHSVHGSSLAKQRLTILFCCNRAGSKTSSLIIGNSKTPQSFRGNMNIVNSLDIEYRNNESAWMTSYLFTEWMQSLDQICEKEGKKIIMLLDNFSGHKVDQSKFKMITFTFFPPNTTSHLQPLDRGIIRSFKSKYTEKLLNKMSANLGQNVSVKEVIKKVKLLDAVQWIDQSWKEVTDVCIQNCWRNSEGKEYLEIERQHQAQIELLKDKLTQLSLQNKRINFCNIHEYMENIVDSSLNTFLVDE